MHFNIYGKLYYDSKLFPAFPIPELEYPSLRAWDLHCLTQLMSRLLYDLLWSV